MSHSQQPCAACKLQRRKCTQECIFAPHFPPDQPQKFADIHKVFGASNVAKMLSELPAMSREEAVISLSYEAGARIRDPVYGCVSAISELQHRLKQMHMEIDAAKQELLKYMGSNNQQQNQNQGLMIPDLTTVGFIAAPTQQHQHHQNQQQNMMMQMIEGGGHQMLDAHQLLATHEMQDPAREQHQHQHQHQDMFRVFEQSEPQQQQQQHNHNHNYGLLDDHVVDSVAANGFGEFEPCLALGSMAQEVNHEQSQVEIPAHQEQLFFHSDHHEPDLSHHHHHQSSGSEEGANSSLALS
ncbi:LOB domain-containing protein 36 [Linum grandiflorum]